MKLYRLLKNNYLEFVILITITLLYSRDLGGLPVSSIAFTLISFVIISPLPYEKFICYLCFMLPLTNGIPASYLNLIFVLLLIKKSRSISKGVVVFTFLFTILELIHFAFHTFNTDVLLLIRYICSLFLFASIAAPNLKIIKPEKCAIYFTIGVTVLIICVLINTFIIGDFSISSIEMRVGDLKKLDESISQKIVLSVNENTMAYYSAVSMSILSLLFIFKKISFSHFFILFFINLLGGLLTISRTWVICVCILLIFIFLSLPSIDHKRKKRIYSIFATCMFAICLIFYLNNNIFDMFINRFLSTTEDGSITTAGGRTLIMEQYYNLITNNLDIMIFGSGVVYYKNVAQNLDQYIIHSMHNSLQQIFFCTGLVGTTTFIYSFYYLLKKYLNNNYLFASIPLLITFIFLQSIQFLSPFYLAYPLSITLLLTNIKKEKVD